MNGEQRELFRLLGDFSGLCRTHGLRWWLAGGTLLGAVRHRGFIPWDDDVDVMMPEADYRRLLAMRESLPEGYLLLTEEDRADYPFSFAELCDLRVPFPSGHRSGPPGIYLDIFPLLPSRKPDRKAEFRFNVISVIGYVLQVKTGWGEFVPYKKAAARLGFAALRRCSVPALRRLRRRLAESLTQENTGWWFSPGGGHKGLTEFYPAEWFDADALLPFETGEFPAPAGWDGYLTRLYGDYMTPPPEGARSSPHRTRADGRNTAD